MGLKVSINVDSTEARRAFSRAPSVMVRHVERQMARGAAELAREMRARAPKAFSHLTNSINSAQVGTMHFRVAPGVRYAPFVEEGTRPGGAPSLGAMIRWLRVKRIGSAKYPQARDLAYAIIRSIRARGTPAQPFAAPAAERMTPRLVELIDRGVDDGLRAAFG